MINPEEGQVFPELSWGELKLWPVSWAMVFPEKVSIVPNLASSIPQLLVVEHMVPTQARPHTPLLPPETKSLPERRWALSLRCKAVVPAALRFVCLQLQKAVRRLFASGVTWPSKKSSVPVTMYCPMRLKIMLPAERELQKRRNGSFFKK